MSAEDALNESKARLEALLAPVNGGVGEDASYDEVFELIKTEIDKVNAIDGGKTDWAQVVTSTEQLLSDRTKDLRLALYFAAGRAQTGGAQGLFDGFVLLWELCQAFWEPMFPPLKRPRARGNLIGWYNELVTPLIQGLNPTLAERDIALATEKIYGDLDGFFADKLGEAYPVMPALRDAVRGFARRAPEPAAPPKPVAVDDGSGTTSSEESDSGTDASTDGAQYEAQAGTGIGIGIGDIVDGESAYRALAEIAPLLGRSAEVLLEANATSADGFRLARQATWLLVGGAPYNEGGQTMLDGPGAHIVEGLTAMAAAGDWNNLATTAWQTSAQFPLWLDAIKLMVDAMENLGSDYDVARVVVARELAALIARAPEIVELKFADGTAFAGPDTKQWISTLAGGAGGGGGRSPVDKAAVEAEKLAAEDKLPQAVAVLSRVATQSASPVYKFRARLEISKLCLKFGQLDIAKAQLEGLERVAEEHRLAAWDPELCAQMYANLYRVRRALTASIDDAELHKKVAQSLERLCELDAAEAFRLMQEGAG